MDGASRILGDEIGVVEGAFVCWYGAPSPVASRPCHPWHWGFQPLGRGERSGEVGVGKSYLNLSQSESDWLRMQVRFGGGRFWWLGMGTLGRGWWYMWA